MSGTKDRILETALELFSRRGYEGVSVSDISGALGMTKSALYKHFPGKRGIFDGILRHMEEADREAARESGVPEESLEKSPERYAGTGMEELKRFALERFDYWTADSLGSKFRRLLTLEQYASEEMGGLYDAYLGSGVLGYVEDILGSGEKALEFYGGMFILMSAWDRATDRAAVRERLKEYIEKFEV